MCTRVAYATTRWSAHGDPRLHQKNGMQTCGFNVLQCVGGWAELKIPNDDVIFYRSWFHIHDLQNLIRRISRTGRQPSFPISVFEIEILLTNVWPTKKLALPGRNLSNSLNPELTTIVWGALPFWIQGTKGLADPKSLFAIFSQISYRAPIRPL